MIDKNMQKLIDISHNIVLIQPDNPDGDSLASSLALESILNGLGKQVELYCGVEIPGYLKYMQGWDRVNSELPKKFDLAIILDTSAISLLESITKSSDINLLKSNPTIIIDHHETKSSIDFADYVYCPNACSTGEALFNLCNEFNWEIDLSSAKFIAFSILSDTLGLSTENVSSRTFLVMSKLAEMGVSVAELNDLRQKLNKKSQTLLKYKSNLIQRIAYSDSGLVASVTIPWDEIQKYSHQYNPSMLVLDEMRTVEKVLVCIAFKKYPDGKLTAKIRTTYGFKMAGKIAEEFGGGGHSYASGFKIMNTDDSDRFIIEVIKFADELASEYYNENQNETIQYTF